MHYYLTRNNFFLSKIFSRFYIFKFYYITIDEFGPKQQMEGQLGPGKQRCLVEKWNETSAKYFS
jgi:hypothetical protein